MEIGYTSVSESTLSELEDLFQKANSLVNAGDIEDAKKCFEELISLKPDLFEPLINLGNVYFNEHEYDKALDYYLKAVELKPSHFICYQNIGNTFARTENYKEAYEAYKKALAIKPGQEQVARNLEYIAQKLLDMGIDIPEYTSETKSFIDKSEYSSQLFENSDLDKAKKIILFDCPDASSEERWINETEFIKAMFSKYIPLENSDCVIDFGCGVGRASKGLVSHFDCSAIGVDISKEMRKHAISYVNSSNFSAISPDVFDAFIDAGLQVDAALSVFVLQHSLTPLEDIQRIKSALKPGGKLFIMNTFYRCVPTGEGFKGDNLSVAELLGLEFDLIKEVSVEEQEEYLSESVIKDGFCRIYQKA